MLMVEKEFTFSRRLWETTSFFHSHRFELLVCVLAKAVAASLLMVRWLIWCDNVDLRWIFLGGVDE